MNFTISKSELINILGIASNILSKKLHQTILSNVYFNALKGKLILTISDMELTIVYEAEAVVEEPGEILVNGKILYDIVKELSDAPITFKSKNQERIELSSGSAVMNIVCNSAVEYPSNLVPEIKNLKAEINPKTLSEMISKTIYAVTNDTSRFMLNSVYMESTEKDKLTLVASDGNRLSVVTREAKGITEDQKFPISAKSIVEIKKVLDLINDETIEFDLVHGKFVLKSKKISLISSLVDGVFPEYKRIIPSKSEQEVTINSGDLLSAVRRLSVINSDRSHAIKFDFYKNFLKLYNSSANLGDGHEEVPINLEGNDFTVGLNSKYLIDFCNCISSADTIKMNISPNLGAIKLESSEDNNFINVVMPMRIINEG